MPRKSADQEEKDSCALMIGVQVRKKEDPPLWDLSLRAPAGG